MDYTPEMQLLKNDINEYESMILTLEDQIVHYKKIIDKKHTQIRNMCEHKWEKERENHMYAELYDICKKCGYCK